MNPTALATITGWVSGRLVSGNPGAMISRVSTDTRTLQAGDLFVAIAGGNFDGHDFVATAANMGAAAALVHQLPIGVPPQFGVLQVADTVRALQQLSSGYRDTLRLRVVGITGSNGKTSTKDLTAAVLGQAFRVQKTAGNLNNHLGVPLTLLSVDPQDEVAVVEIGMNHPGEIAPLAALARPDVAIITNIGVAHIEYMGSRGAIAQEKGMLGEAVHSDGTVILNAEDDMTPGIARRCKAKVLTAGLQVGDVRATALRVLPGAMQFTLQHEGKSVAAVVPVLGEHMVRNAALACAAGLALGLSLEQCAAGLAKLELSKGRLQTKKIGNLTVLDDSYNANPDSVVAGLATLASIPGGGRRIAILGRMGELGKEAESGHRRVGRAAGEKGISCVIAVGDHAHWIAEEARASGVPSVIPVADTASAATALRDFAQAGDVVLVKGSRSAKMERVIQALESGGTQ
jgi:UDP-N-acetylmuramoyl-tripeptide--D-alanyl-D-alanine ligase